MRDAQEHVLVILAMNLDCLVTVDPEGYWIHSEEPFRSAILEEFRLYSAEQKYAYQEVTVPIFGSGFEVAMIWVVLLLFSFVRQLEVPGYEDRYLNSSVAVFGQGEFWRPFTSLFLHADMEHLAGNAVFGLIFGLFVANSFGSFRGWGLILFSGFLGNLLVASLHFPSEFRSLGASTAVFGALGLLVGSGLELAWREQSYRKGLRAFAPLLAGIMIFTMSGIGGPGTDTAAHIAGMFWGILLGFTAAWHLVKKSDREPTGST